MKVITSMSVREFGTLANLVTVITVMIFAMKGRVKCLEEKWDGVRGHGRLEVLADGETEPKTFTDPLFVLKVQTRNVATGKDERGRRLAMAVEQAVAELNL